MTRIGIAPWDDHGGMAVFRDLDPHDAVEAAVVRGGDGASHLALFADWRAMRPAWILSHVLTGRAGLPFAVLALCHTGQAGVAQAAFLARNHQRFRRDIASAACMIRARMPGFAVANGIRRVEARCWAAHPTAPDFLFALGFAPECIMAGFGPDGRAEFIQYAYVPPQPKD